MQTEKWTIWTFASELLSNFQATGLKMFNQWANTQWRFYEGGLERQLETHCVGLER